MDSKKTPKEYKDKYMLSFVEMGWADSAMVDPRYKDWTAGRVEIHTYESEFDIGEKHFCSVLQIPRNGAPLRRATI